MEKGGIVQPNSDTSFVRLYPALGTNNKYIHELGSYKKKKKKKEIASYALLHMTYDLYYIVSPGAAPLNTNKFLVSKETVVLRRWERSKQKFGFIKRVDKG